MNLNEVKFSSRDSYYDNKKVISSQTVEKKGRVCVCASLRLVRSDPPSGPADFLQGSPSLALLRKSLASWS